MKITKRLIVTLLVILMCLSLAGCKELDIMRQKQGFWNKDGILWNGTTYKLLNTNGDYLNFKTDEDIAVVYITQSDVPVLVSEFFGMHFDVCNDKLILDGGTEGIYCREDSYDTVVKSIKEGFVLDRVCYDYCVYDKDGWYDHEETYVLTDDQKAELLELYDTLEPIVLEDGMYLSEDNIVFLYGISKDGLLKKDLVTILQAGERYYIEDAENTYLIPEEMNSVFAEIMECEVKANQDMDYQ